MSTNHQALQGFRRTVKEHIVRVRDLSSLQSAFVPNSELHAFADPDGPVPEIILVADNPGAKEQLHGVYLCGEGRAGSMARQFFDTALGSPSFGHSVMVLNKSSYHTPRTAGLAQIQKTANASFLATFRADQEANAQTAGLCAAALQIPVVTIGCESDGATFQAFRRVLQSFSDVPSLSTVFFRSQLVSPAFRKVPHFSLSKIFCRHADPAWNARIVAFGDRWKGSCPDLVTPNGNLSSKAFLSSRHKPMHLDFLTTVILA